MKAVALFSGGLDSVLAVKIIQTQGLEVVPVAFLSHFFDTVKAHKYARANSLDLVTVDISHKHFEILLHPEYGYGKGMNPCIDCHALMIKEAYQLLRKMEAEFLITGDVLGQRPFSQTREGLSAIDRLSGLGDITLRPLSAKLLKPTRPEREGIINRETLYGISGRSRKLQMRLVGKFNVSEFGSPAGGCILTSKVYSERLSVAIEQCSFNEGLIPLVGIGRHFYLNESLFIVSRNEKEGKILGEDSSSLFELVDAKGPSGRFFECKGRFKGQRGVPERDDSLLAARILARYAGSGPAKVKLPDGKIITVEPLDKFMCDRLLVSSV